MTKLTPEFLRKILRYEPDTGKLFWRERTPDMFANGRYSAKRACAAWNGKFAGKEALTAIGSEGYRHGRVWGRELIAHRVIWAIHHGEWPKNLIDHENRVRSDNRITNLRGATNRDNQRNQKRPTSNTSGVTGVSWHRRDKKWVARINDETGRKYLGAYTEKSDAITARRTAEKLLGYHPNHGRLAAC